MPNDANGSVNPGYQLKHVLGPPLAAQNVLFFEEGRELFLFCFAEGHKRAISALKYSPDGRLLASSCTDSSKKSAILSSFLSVPLAVFFYLQPPTAS